ncbi:hypothetical protein [Microbacterium sp. CIAB417]|uniref:hypothetical protein n=1 Tax=Microbacterium sp. CIAB417 TaxID=2860287 RepID=UPI001FAB5C1F|nr:hypothetical protein [Microbacterium sp. CIAB417]
MDSILYLCFAGAYAALLAWGLILLALRGRPSASDFVLLVILGLVYDNAILGFGAMIGEGPALEAANAARFWLHALLTPLLVVVAWSILARSGIRWAMRPAAVVVAVLVTLALMAYEIVVGATGLVLEPVREYGSLSYDDASAASGPPLMVLAVAAALLVAGIGVWVRRRWPWLTIVTVIMVAGSAVPIPVDSGAATNAFELILLIGIVATIAFQDSAERRDRPTRVGSAGLGADSVRL